MQHPHVEESLIESAAAQVDPARRELFAAFAGAVLAGVESHPAGGTGLLGTVALEAFEWAAKRAPGEILVRVRNPLGRD